MIRIFILALSLIFMGACASLPKQHQVTDNEVFIIDVGSGPEDMILDTISENDRLLISCNSRRKDQIAYGEIYVYYPKTNTRKLMIRIGEPHGLSFNPHGIDLVQVKDSLLLLVVNHETTKGINAVIRYQVFKDELVFINKIVDPLITSPNAVAGFTDGTILISNDAKKAQNFWEILFKLKKAKIAYWNGNYCTVAAGNFCYANGIAIQNKKVFLASTMQNKVWQFDFENGKMLNKEIVVKNVKGADNIRFDGTDLLVPCHLKFMAFLGHLKDSTKLSPSTVYRINPVSKTKTVEFYDSGKKISAASTALIYKDSLYISGIFDAKIVRLKK